MAVRGTILVADDEGLARRSIVELLQEEGYQVYEAADGTAALQLLDEVDVDVVR
jgi:CheY-like chemotaxis protein